MMFKYKYANILILVILIILGSYLRLSNLEQTSFQSHVIPDLEISENIANGKDCRLAGITTSREIDGQQQTFGPASYYLFAIPLIFTNSPLAVVAFMALLSIFSIVLCYKFGKEFFNEKVGLIAAALYAVNPWSVYFSNVLTSPFLMPIFIIGFMYCLFNIIIKKKDKQVILCLILLAILLQLHLSALWLVFVMAVSLILFKRDINLKYLMIGIIIAALFFIPFIYNALNHPASPSILSHAVDRASGTTGWNVVETLGIPFVIAGTYFGKYMFGMDYIFNNFLSDKLFMIITAGIVISLILGLFFIFYNGIKKLKKQYILLLIWFILPIALYLLLFNKNISPHFYLILYPSQFLILGILFDHTYHKNKVLTALMIIFFVMASTIYSIGVFNYLDDNGGAAITRLTYKTRAEVVDFILEDANNLNPTINYLGEAPEKSYNYIFELRGAHPNYIKLDSYSALYDAKGYFVSERYWRRYWFNENLSSGAEILDTLQATNIHHVEIFRLTN